VWQVLRCVCVPVFTGLQVLGVCCAGFRCVRLSVGVCACLCACGAPCCAVGVAVWQVLPCVVLQVLRCGLRLCAVLWCWGVLLSIKTRVYSVF